MYESLSYKRFTHFTFIIHDTVSQRRKHHYNKTWMTMRLIRRIYYRICECIYESVDDIYHISHNIYILWKKRDGFGQYETSRDARWILLIPNRCLIIRAIEWYNSRILTPPSYFSISSQSIPYIVFWIKINLYGSGKCCVEHFFARTKLSLTW